MVPDLVTGGRADYLLANPPDTLGDWLAVYEYGPRRPWWWDRRCCDLATWGPACVCTYNFSCPKHGERHVGTHD